MEENADDKAFGKGWEAEYLEEYVKKYLEGYEESTNDTSEESDETLVDWDFQKTGLLEREKQWLKSKRRKKVKKHLHNMVNYSTFHGLQFCFKRESPLRRTIWIILLLVCNGLLIQKMFESTQNYLDYPFSTAKSVKYNKSLAFPAVSLCNLNDIRLSQMLGTTLHQAIVKKDQNLSAQLSGDEYTKTIRNANHNLKEMLYGCSIDGRKCLPRDFLQFYHKQGDKCFTFNSGAPGYKFFQVNKIGPKHALELTIHTEFWDYYLDAVQSGMHMILHGQEETPVKMQGIMVPPGYITYVEVKKQMRRNLPSPYKTKCGSLQLKYFKGYSMHLCWLEKLTDHVVSICGCKEWFMPGGYKVCSLKVLKKCLWPSWAEERCSCFCKDLKTKMTIKEVSVIPINVTAEFDKLKKYSCPLPCLIESFTTKTSISRFPTNEDATAISDELKLNGTRAENHKFLRDNFLKIVVYYGDLSYEYLEQKPTYDLLVFLGDIGGQIGLFVGASVLTFFEFIDCFFMCIHARFFEIFKPRETRL